MKILRKGEMMEFKELSSELNSEEMISEEAVSSEDKDLNDQDLNESLEQSLDADLDDDSNGTQKVAQKTENDSIQWYVVHTYSGYENKVKANIEKSIQNLHLEDQILNVEVPMQDVVELKNGKKKTVQRKLFPGYVLLHMVMNDETWYVVRNTRGVTGFVGPESKPVPLSEAEMANMGIREPEIEVDFEVGDEVTVISGVWKDTVGQIRAMNMAKQVVTIGVDMFGRETAVEISFLDIKKM